MGLIRTLRRLSCFGGTSIDLSARLPIIPQCSSILELMVGPCLKRCETDGREVHWKTES